MPSKNLLDCSNNHTIGNTGTGFRKTLKFISSACLLSSSGVQAELLNHDGQVQRLETVFGQEPLCYGFGRQFTTLNTENTDPEYDKTVALAELVLARQVRPSSREDTPAREGVVD